MASSWVWSISRVRNAGEWTPLIQSRAISAPKLAACTDTDAGATRAVTQFFFDIEAFLRFRDRVRAAGVIIPLIPGVMPVSNFAGLKRMTSACGAALPDWLAAHFDGLDDDPETRKLLAASIAAETCARLQEEGFSDFHFYTLNRAELVYAICRVLGVREAQADA